MNRSFQGGREGNDSLSHKNQRTGRTNAEQVKGNGLVRPNVNCNDPLFVQGHQGEGQKVYGYYSPFHRSGYQEELWQNKSGKFHPNMGDDKSFGCHG